MTNIEWADKSWNPVVGCELASPGCTNCYAMAQAKRNEEFGLEAYRGLTKHSKAGPVWSGVLRLQDNVIGAPLKRKKPTVYFVCSMSDLFQSRVHDQWRDRVFDVMEDCPQHMFLILTKRPDIMRHYVERRYDGGFVPSHIWLGASVEDQVRVDLRLPELVLIQANLFASAEPLLGQLDIFDHIVDSRIHWVIGGGESGKNARLCHPDWAASLRDQCAATGTKFMWKQWGQWKPTIVDGEWRFAPLGKSHSGRRIDGQLHDDRPFALHTLGDIFEEAAE